MTPLLLLLFVILPNAVFSRIIEESETSENRCNQEISLERSVGLFEECRSIANCRSLGERAQCVNKRDNFCVCQLDGKIEERKPHKYYNKNKCNKQPGLKCVPKDQCKRKHFRRQDKTCDKGKRCCAYCEPSGFECVEPGECPSVLRKNTYSCGNRKKSVCCTELDAMYGEPCKHDAECIEAFQKCDLAKTSTCKCVKGTSYDAEKGACMHHMKHGQMCKSKVQCVDKFQECDLEGSKKCKCMTDYIFDSMTKKCYPEKAYGDPCEVNVQCTEAMELCGAGGKTCECNAAISVFDAGNTECVSYKNYGDSCVIDAQCNGGDQYCFNGLCQCTGAKTFDSVSGGCYDSKAHGEACEVTHQCDDGNQECSGGTCACTSGYVFITSQCEPVADYGDACVDSAQCTSDYNECDGKWCVCTTDATFSSYGCVPYRNYGEGCQDTVQCDTTNYQECSSFMSTCDCISGYLHDGSSCVLQANVGEACSGPICVTMDSECSGGFCVCISDYVESSGSCYAYASYDEGCSVSEQCADDSGLQTCTYDSFTFSSVCKCDDTRAVWDVDAGVCKLISSLGQSCDISDQCQLPSDTTQSCEGGICVCKPGVTIESGGTCYDYKDAYEDCNVDEQCTVFNMSCISSQCNCASGKTYVSDIDDCLPEKNLDDYCTYDGECERYAGPTFMECTSNACTCYTTRSGSSCSSPVGYGNACTVDWDCSGMNMVCESNTCTCPSTHIHETGSCYEANKVYGEECSIDAQCTEALQACIPDESYTMYCTCDSTAVRDYDAGVCRSYVSYGAACVIDGQCSYSVPDTICDSSTSTCQCPDTHVFDSGSCHLLAKYGEACSIAAQCTGTNHVCDSGSCACGSGYDAVENEVCYLTVPQGTPCTVQAECADNLNICLNGVCSCDPALGVDSGSDSCLTYKATGEGCTIDAECKEPLEGCVDGACDCGGPGGFFNDMTSCVPSKAYGQPCELDGECKGNNQECSGGACSCASGYAYEAGSSACESEES